MKNWQQRVREHLEPCELPPSIRDEVIFELAAHLQEVYEESRATGLTETAAIGLTLEEVENWRGLAKQISRAKSKEDPMNNRTKSLWLPATVNLLASMLVLMIMQRLDMQPRLIWVHATAGKFAMVFYFPWLLCLPPCGAVGAYLARRAQGERLACLAAGLSPALALIGLIFLVAPWSLLLDGLSLFRLVLIVTGLLTWGVLPAVALLAGALPVLLKPRHA